MNFRERSRVAATSKMECFVIIVNSFQPLTIITKHSILDVAAALDPPLSIIALLQEWELINNKIQDYHSFLRQNKEILKIILKTHQARLLRLRSLYG